MKKEHEMSCKGAKKAKGMKEKPKKEHEKKITAKHKAK